MNEVLQLLSQLERARAHLASEFQFTLSLAGKRDELVAGRLRSIADKLAGLEFLIDRATIAVMEANDGDEWKTGGRPSWAQE